MLIILFAVGFSFSYFNQMSISGLVLGRKTGKGPKKTAPTATPIPVSPTATPSLAAPTPEPTTPPPGTKQWGAYTGWRVEDVDYFEQQVGAKMDFLATFVHWGNENEFPSQLAELAKSKGQTLVIFWEAMDYNFSGPLDNRFSYDRILAGDWDQYLIGFARSCRDYNGPVILIPFEEMNSDWYPWSGTINGNTPEKHKLAYRYLRTFFSGIESVKFGWDVNAVSVPDTEGNRIGDFYPGSDYVDYVGVNGFNFGSPWMSFEDIFADALTKLTGLQKPMMIFSMACAEGPEKPAWITDALTKQIPSYPGLTGWIWFNENKEKDWRVWSDGASLISFRNGLLP